MNAHLTPGDGTLLALFIADAAEHGALLARGLLELSEGANEQAAISQELSCAAQSLKGAARIVGCAVVASLAEELERALMRVEKGDQSLEPELRTSMQAAAQPFT